MNARKLNLDRDRAQTIALMALAFLARDMARLGRFLALTGIGPADLKQNARSPQTLTAILDHLLQDESLLLVFTSDAGLEPEIIAPARQLLAGDAGLRTDE